SATARSSARWASAAATVSRTPRSPRPPPRPSERASAERGRRSAALAVLPQAARELVVGPVGGDPEPGDELLAVLFGQQAVQSREEDRPVRPPQRAGDDRGDEIVVGRS